MFVDFICNNHCDKLGNAGKDQVCMERLLIMGPASGNTIAVLEVIDGLFHIYTYFISGHPFPCATDCARISTEVLSQIDVDHSSTGR